MWQKKKLLNTEKHFRPVASETAGNAGVSFSHGLPEHRDTRDYNNTRDRMRASPDTRGNPYLDTHTINIVFLLMFVCLAKRINNNAGGLELGIQ